MKTLKKVYVLLSILIAFNDFSQVPGYMGKRFIVGYGASTSPAIFGSNGNGNSIFGHNGGNANTETFALNFHQEGFVEYALSKKMMIGFSARFYKTTYDNSRVTYGNIYNTDSYGYVRTQTISGDLNGLYYINGVNFTLYGKLFFGKYLAPWGTYMLFGPTIRRYSCTYDPVEMNIAYRADNYPYTTKRFSNFGDTKQSFTRFDISFGIGKSRILYNRITVDYGFNMQVFAFAFTLFDVIDEGLSDTNPTPDQYMAKTAPWRVRGANRFNVFCKVGVLLF